MLSDSDIQRYNASRRRTDKQWLCHAPFVNLNFEQNGNITACCYNRRELLGRYPQDRIVDAWRGAAAEALRSQIRNAELEGGCALCRELIQAGNYAGAKSRSYDEYARHKWWPAWLRPEFDARRDMPRVVELELSNTCNLECAMCTGYFSSTIRKNRDHLPPLPMVYDEAFVQQLTELMPGLTDMKFLGGEPFLIDLYYDIWDAVIRVNQSIMVHITTNATVWNNRVRSLLEKLKAGIVVSLDSLDPEVYARIRSGAQLDKTLRNITHFRELTRKKGSFLSIAVCPMTTNWKEMPDLLRFANEQGAFVHFNVVISPEHLSLRSLSVEELREVCVYLESRVPVTQVVDWLGQKNRKAYLDMLTSIRSWLHEKESRTDDRRLVRESIQSWLDTGEYLLYAHSASCRDILAGILHFELGMQLPPALLEAVSPAPLHTASTCNDWLNTRGLRKEARKFCLDFLHVLHGLMQGGYGEPDHQIRDKFQLLSQIIENAGRIEQLAQDLTETPAMTQLDHIREYSYDDLRSLMEARYH